MWTNIYFCFCFDFFVFFFFVNYCSWLSSILTIVFDTIFPCMYPFTLLVLYISLTLDISVCLSVSLSLLTSLSVYLSHSWHLCLSVCLTLCVSMSLCIDIHLLSIWQSFPNFLIPFNKSIFSLPLAPSPTLSLSLARSLSIHASLLNCPLRIYFSFFFKFCPLDCLYLSDLLII